MADSFGPLDYLSDDEKAELATHYSGALAKARHADWEEVVTEEFLKAHNEDAKFTEEIFAAPDPAVPASQPSASVE